LDLRSVIEKDVQAEVSKAKASPVNLNATSVVVYERYGARGTTANKVARCHDG
jgi:hypothetical protein